MARASEQCLRSIIDCSLEMIITTNNEQGIVEFNGTAEEIFGRTREQVLGQHIYIYVFYASFQEAEAAYQTVVEEGKLVGKINNRRKNAKVFVSLLSAAVLRDSHGRRLGIWHRRGVA